MVTARRAAYSVRIEPPSQISCRASGVCLCNGLTPSRVVKRVYDHGRGIFGLTSSRRARGGGFRGRRGEVRWGGSNNNHPLRQSDDGTQSEERFENVKPMTRSTRSLVSRDLVRERDKKAG